MFDIKIRPVLNGWVCKVGCAEVVFDNKAQMLSELGCYIDNPQATEKKYQDNAINKNIDRLPPELPSEDREPTVEMTGRSA